MNAAQATVSDWQALYKVLATILLSTKTWQLMYPLIAAITYPLLQTCLNGIYIGDVCRSLPKEIAIFNKVWNTRRFSTGWNEIIITWSCTLVPFTDSREFLRGSPPCSKPHQQSGKCPGFRVVPFLSTVTVKSHTLFTSPSLVMTTELDSSEFCCLFNRLTWMNLPTSTGSVSTPTWMTSWMKVRVNKPEMF